MSLSNEEIEACREAFARFDKDNSGAIDAWELRATLQCAPPASHASSCVGASPVDFAVAAMGQDPTDEELFDMIAEVDSDGSGEIGAPDETALARALPNLAVSPFGRLL